MGHRRQRPGRAIGRVSCALVARTVLPGRHEAQDAPRTGVDDSRLFAAAVDHGDGVDEAALLRDAESEKPASRRML